MAKYQYSECRARLPGHDWSPVDRRKGSFGYYLVDICSRCTTTRTRVLSFAGRPVTGWFRYPSDYKDPRAMTVADYRAEVLGKLRLAKIDRTVAELLVQRSEALREALNA